MYEISSTISTAYVVDAYVRFGEKLVSQVGYLGLFPGLRELFRMQGFKPAEAEHSHECRLLKRSGGNASIRRDYDLADSHVVARRVDLANRLRLARPASSGQKDDGLGDVVLLHHLGDRAVRTLPASPLPPKEGRRDQSTSELALQGAKRRAAAGAEILAQPSALQRTMRLLVDGLQILRVRNVGVAGPVVRRFRIVHRTVRSRPLVSLSARCRCARRFPRS